MKNLFLEGSSGVGKSTAILRALGSLTEKAGGFSVARLHDANGQLGGFRVRSAAGVKETDEPADDSKPGIFIRFLPEGGFKKESIFVKTAAELLADAGKHPYLILDEFGGIELKDREFIQTLKEVIASDIPCIGVIKSRANALHMMRKLPAERNFEGVYDEFRSFIEKEADTVIFEMTRENRENAEKLISEWMEANHVGNI